MPLSTIGLVEVMMPVNVLESPPVEGKFSGVTTIVPASVAVPVMASLSDVLPVQSARKASAPVAVCVYVPLKLLVARAGLP